MNVAQFLEFCAICKLHCTICQLANCVPISNGVHNLSITAVARFVKFFDKSQNVAQHSLQILLI